MGGRDSELQAARDGPAIFERGNKLPACGGIHQGLLWFSLGCKDSCTRSPVPWDLTPYGRIPSHIRRNMSAYLVFTKEKTLDPAEMAIYQQNVVDTFGSFQHKVLAAYGAQEVLEGDPVEGVVILEFPTAEEAKAW